MSAFIGLRRLTLLCQQKSIALLDSNAVPAVLVVGREASRVSALGDLSVNDLLEGVDTLGRIRRVGDVHEMHSGGVCVNGDGGWGGRWALDGW